MLNSLETLFANDVFERSYLVIAYNGCSTMQLPIESHFCKNLQLDFKIGDEIKYSQKSRNLDGKIIKMAIQWQSDRGIKDSAGIKNQMNRGHLNVILFIENKEGVFSLAVDEKTKLSDCVEITSQFGENTTIESIALRIGSYTIPKGAVFEYCKNTYITKRDHLALIA